MKSKLKLGDIVYYKNDPCTIIRKASPYVFGYLAKQDYVMVEVSAEIAAKWRRYPKEGFVRIYAIPPDRLTNEITP